MIRWLVAVMRVVDRRVIYFFMALVVPFYMLFGHKGFVSSWHFFRDRIGCGPLKTFCKVYANHFRFGQVIVDRYAAFAGKKFRFETDGNDSFMALAESENGFVQLSSHIGNYEMVGYGMTSVSKKVNGLVYAGESEVMMEMRRKILEMHNVGLIPVDGSMSHIFEMNAAIDRGEIVSMTGDRIFGSQKAVTCTFMGSEARFPMGPYILAAQKQVPLLAVFAMRQKGGAYRVICRKLEADADASSPLKVQAAAYARAFAAELEKVVCEYPTQWFNWYDFWKQ